MCCDDRISVYADRNSDAIDFAIPVLSLPDNIAIRIGNLCFAVGNDIYNVQDQISLEPIDPFFSYMDSVDVVKEHISILQGIHLHPIRFVSFHSTYIIL